MTSTLPQRLNEDGHFPFGRENGPRPFRDAAEGTCKQIVIGTYPSALHVDWSAPEDVPRPDGATGRAHALAIDVEPTVFWDGDSADELVAQWAERVGFLEGDGPGCHGHLGAAINGPSGSGLLDKYFPALPFTEQETAFVDVYPVYFVKRGAKGSRGGRGVRGQADVMDSEYNSVVQHLRGFAPATLPLRPSAHALPGLAADRFGAWLTHVLDERRPDHIVTLGEEVCSTLRRLPDIALDPAFTSLSATRTSGYGITRILAVAGREVAWTPLGHPGLVRQSGKTPGTWGSVHDTWLHDGRRHSSDAA